MKRCSKIISSTETNATKECTKQENTKRAKQTNIPYFVKILKNIKVFFNFSEQGYKAIALLVVSKSNNISLVRTMRLSFYGMSICPMEGDMFILSTCGHPRAVRTITVSGHEGDVQHACLPDKTFKGGESQCTYVEAHKTVVFTDRDDHTVYMSNIENGRCHIELSDQIRFPKGACPCIDGTVFVCSAGTGCILQLTTQGTVLTTHDISMAWPFAVSLSRDGTRLAVSNSEKDKQKKIKLFKILR